MQFSSEGLQTRRCAEIGHLIDKPCATQAIHNRDQGPRVMHKGDAAHVFSRSVDKWVVAEVVEFLECHHVRVEYKIGEIRFRKSVSIHSGHLAILEQEWRNPLQHVSMSSDRESDSDCNGWDAHESLRRDVCVSCAGAVDLQSVVDAFQLTCEGNSSFATKTPLSKDYSIHYQGSFDEDVILKVYMLVKSATQSDRHRYELKGYINAMQRPRMSIHVDAVFFVGFSLHKDLNKDWLWKMKAEDPEKYESYLSRSVPGGYEQRGDTLAKCIASEADYLISFTTSNKQENDRLLVHLASTSIRGPHCATLSGSPITFCTDRSLGFGGHFDSANGFYLAKHGFAQPVEAGAWFAEYARAAHETKMGVLVINPSVEYFKSGACLREWEGIPQNRRWLYNGYRIVDSSIIRHQGHLGIHSDRFERLDEVLDLINKIILQHESPDMALAALLVEIPVMRQHIGIGEIDWQEQLATLTVEARTALLSLGQRRSASTGLKWCDFNSFPILIHAVVSCFESASEPRR